MGPLAKAALVGAGRALVGQVAPKYQQDPAPRRWHTRTRRERARAWWTLLVAVVATGYGLVVDPVATWSNWSHIGVLVAAWLIYVWVYVNRKAQVNRQVKRPLGASLTTYLNDSIYTTNPDQMMRLAIDPVNQASTIYVPQYWNPGTERKELELARLVGRKLGLGATPNYDLVLRGARPYLKVWPAPEPPDEVLFSDPKVRDLYEKSTAHEPFLGLAARRAPFYLNRLSSAPHTGLSATTNAGKSSARRPTVAKAIHDGWLVLVLDPKQDSQTWAESLPAVHYAVKAPELYRALRWLSDEVDRRFAIFREHKNIDGEMDDPSLVGPPILVEAEELNSMELDLRHWWKEVRQSNEPQQCTAMHALQRCLNMGRGVGIYVEVIAQALTCNAMGGVAALENVPLRMLMWPTHATWNRLAPQCRVAGKFPRTGTKRQGRMHVVSGDEATAVQSMWMTPREAYDYAVSGEMSTFPEVREVGSTVRVAAETSAEQVPTLDDVSDVVEPGDELLTLAEFSAETGIKVKAMDNARTAGKLAEPVFRSPGRPSKYRRADLELWAAGRPDYAPEDAG
jgi:hypothetical protein